MPQVYSFHKQGSIVHSHSPAALIFAAARFMLTRPVVNQCPRPSQRSVVGHSRRPTGANTRVEGAGTISGSQIQPNMHKISKKRSAMILAALLSLRLPAATANVGDLLLYCFASSLPGTAAASWTLRSAKKRTLLVEILTGCAFAQWSPGMAQETRSRCLFPTNARRYSLGGRPKFVR